MVRFSDDGRHFFQEVTVPVRFVVRGDTQWYIDHIRDMEEDR